MIFKKYRIVAGLLIWIAGVVFCISFVSSKWGDDGNARTARSLTNFALQSRSERELTFKTGATIRIGDPIYFRNKKGKLFQVGVLKQCENLQSQDYEEIWCHWARADFFSSAPHLKDGAYLTFHETPASMDWVARFLFPPERRKKIAVLISNLYLSHSDQVIEDLKPILEAVWKETSIIVRDEMMASLKRHRDEFERIGMRYRAEIIERELVPLVNEEIWPIVLVEAKPIMESVGQDIWSEASVFRFGWRALYDASPLPEKNLTADEFSRFVEDEAMPVLQDHLPDVMEAQQTIVRQVVANPRVQQVIRESLNKVTKDPELHAVVMDVLKESLLENDMLLVKLEESWRRPDLQKLLRSTDILLEPVVQDIGEMVFGSPWDGVTPEFARVLRNKILLKDMRWFEIHFPEDESETDAWMKANSSSTTMPVIRGTDVMDNPFYYPARER